MNILESAKPHQFEAARTETIEGLDLASVVDEDTYDAVVRLLAKAMNAPVSLFSVVYRDKQVFKARIGLDSRETSRNVSFCAHAINQNHSDLFEVEDATLDERFADNPLVSETHLVGSYIGAVVNAPNNLPVGTICSIAPHKREFSDYDRACMRDAKQLMEAALLMKSQSIKDYLTGLYNRRSFDDHLQREWGRAYRHLVPFTLLLLDIDNFKAYNDTFGHAAGDECLRKVADAIRSVASRAGDLVARYGGEEFVAVLPESGLEPAKMLAENIRTVVEALNIDNPGGAHRKVTLSIGGAVVSSKEHLIRGTEAMLALADTNLYKCKDEGRNRVSIQEMI